MAILKEVRDYFLHGFSAFCTEYKSILSIKARKNIF